MNSKKSTQDKKIKIRITARRLSDVLMENGAGECQNSSCHDCGKSEGCGKSESSTRSSR